MEDFPLVDLKLKKRIHINFSTPDYSNYNSETRNYHSTSDITAPVLKTIGLLATFWNMDSSVWPFGQLRAYSTEIGAMNYSTMVVEHSNS